MKRHDPVRLTLHHTEVLVDGTPSTVRARGHQRHHQDTWGVPDLVYHFLVDTDGHILQGRDLAFEGDTETSYDTTGHLLVCCEGDFDSQRPSAAMLRSVSELFAWASQEYGIPPATIRGHRDYAPGEKTCPGKYLYREIRNGTLTRMTARLAETARVELDYLSVPASRRQVRRIEAASRER